MVSQNDTNGQESPNQVFSSIQPDQGLSLEVIETKDDDGQPPHDTVTSNIPQPSTPSHDPEAQPQQDSDSHPQQHSRISAFLPKQWLPALHSCILGLFSHLHHFRDGLLAILLVIVCQFLMWGLDRLVKLGSDDFPAAIVGMILVFLVMFWCNRVDPKVEIWYMNVLGESTSLVNRHMSIGFTVPFVKALNMKFRDTRHIGIAVGCFCVTGILNAAIMYFLALGAEKLYIICPWRKEKSPDEEIGLPRPESQTLPPGPLALFGTQPCHQTPNNHDCENHKNARRTGGGVWGLIATFRGYFRSLCCFLPCHCQASYYNKEEGPRSTTIIQAEKPTRPAIQNMSSKYLSGTSTLSAAPSSLLAGTEEEGQTPTLTSNERSSIQSQRATPLQTPTSVQPLCRFPNLLPHIPAILTGSLILLVGIPLAFLANHTTTLDTLVLFTFWFGTISLQSLIRQACWGRIGSGHTNNNRRDYQCILRRILPALHSSVVVLLNAVLISSLGMMAYILLKDRVTSKTLDQTLAEFVTDRNVSSLFGSGGGGPSHDVNGGVIVADDEMSTVGSTMTSTGLGAGDIATSILNAGIVVWGFKLFECRKQLLSFSGITVVIVSSVAAVSNFFLGPMLGYAMGLDAPEALAFAARSVTLALGGPVVHSLGGNVTINAAMVVLNGLVFQIAGDWIFKKMHLDEDGLASSLIDADSGNLASSQGGHSHETIAATDIQDQHQKGERGRLVAAGVTVGINAAAMGTAHLYERRSVTAPFSALSMTVIGVATVIVSAIEPASQFIVSYVGGELKG